MTNSDQIDKIIEGMNDSLTPSQKAKVQKMTSEITPALIETIEALSERGATVRQVAELSAGLMARAIVRGTYN